MLKFIFVCVYIFEKTISAWENNSINIEEKKKRAIVAYN